MAKAKLFYVLLTESGGNQAGYVVAAKDENIALDVCIRAHLAANPWVSFRSQSVYETTLEAPLKVLEA